MILLIDNYDSFTWNLVHLIGGLGFEVSVVRNDAMTAAEAVERGAEAIVLSPGPGTPADAGICVETVTLARARGVPIFGVCLGLQSITQAAGGRVIRAGKQMHGKTSIVRHQGEGLFKGLPPAFRATRYHSLVADPSSLPNSVLVTAHAEDDGEIMAIELVDAPIAGVQFHPESIASEFGTRIFSNFMATARGRQSAA